MRRILAVVCIIGATVIGSGSAAHAAPPSNDDIENATVVTEVPFYDSIDTSEATYATGDKCGVATVWYEYTPTEDGVIEVYAYSEFSAVLDMRFPGEDPNDRGCSEGASLSNRVSAGATYFISVGTLTEPGDPPPPGQVGPGGPLQVQMVQQPLPAESIEITVDRDATLGDDGLVTVTGTVTCDRAARAEITVQVVQRTGRHTVEGYNYGDADCGPEVSTWRVQLYSYADPSYRPGSARVSVAGYAGSGWTELSGPLRLRRAR